MRWNPLSNYTPKTRKRYRRLSKLNWNWKIVFFQDTKISVILLRWELTQQPWIFSLTFPYTNKYYRDEVLFQDMSLLRKLFRWIGFSTQNNIFSTQHPRNSWPTFGSCAFKAYLKEFSVIIRENFLPALIELSFECNSVFGNFRFSRKWGLLLLLEYIDNGYFLCLLSLCSSSR